MRGTYILCAPEELVRGRRSDLLFTDGTTLDGEQCRVPGTLAAVLTYASLLCSC